MAHERAKPRAEWLQHLHEAKQWERLVDVARECLAADPNDDAAHRHLAWAYARMDQPKKMAPHVEHLLRSNAENLDHHHLAALHRLEMRQPVRAKNHIDLLLRGAPENPNYHYLACIHALRTNAVPAAQHHIRLARRFAPEWAAAAHLEVKIASLGETKAHEAWDRIRRLKETLALDPENEDVMASLGDVHLRELEQPRAAEKYYRDALALDPTSAALQRKLLDAVRARSLLYRTLSLPITAAREIRRNLSEDRSKPTSWLSHFRIATLVGIWILIVGILFVPAAKVYEWLVLSDVTRRRQEALGWTPLSRLLLGPFWLRLAAALGIILAGWMWLVAWFNKSSLLDSAEVIAWIFGLHFVGVALWVGVRKLRATIGRWRHARGCKGQAEPALPSEESAERL
jgi:tetratricopeptide (TPR) repeat protein